MRKVFFEIGKIKGKDVILPNESFKFFIKSKKIVIIDVLDKKDNMKCLWLFRHKDYIQKVSNKKGLLPISSQSVYEIEYDETGFLKIPENLLKSHDFKKEISIIIFPNHIELWNPAVFNSYRKSIKNDEEFWSRINGFLIELGLF